MSWFASQQVEGYAPPNGNTGFAGGGAYDINYEGAQSDPFAYTQGSLLTPWTRSFQAPPGSGGGYAVPEFKAFEHENFAYRAADPGTFQENYAGPGNFVYGDFQAPAPFQAPSMAEAQEDQGYQFAVKQRQKALEASKAVQGLLKTGGTAKALMDYGQQAGSQQYDKVYGRKASEYDRAYGQAKDLYGTNRANTAENWDRNVGNARTAYQLRQGTWRDNAAVTLDSSRHGYDVAQGTYDRNLGLARQRYDDEASHRAALAAAGNAGANRDYDRAMNEYLLARDEFWTNQDRQHAILDREATRGWDAAAAYGSTMADLALGRGNAQASGRVGSANAWTGALGNVGNAAMDIGMWAYGNRQPRPVGTGATPAAAGGRVPSVPTYGGLPPGRMPGQNVGYPGGVARYSGLPRTGNPWG